MKPLIAVTGKNGQLGWELQRLSTAFPQFSFIFCDRNELDITNEQQVSEFFDTNKPAIFINCAAYTAVDKAETEQEQAYAINAAAVGSLAMQCRKHDTFFITLSTDYVFNGNGTEPYKEEDTTSPVNYYGYTKEAGEQLALNNWQKTVIIRTSWVYSSHGHNFVKTMLRLMSERSDINVVSDQVGSPSYAKDIAEAIMQIASSYANNEWGQTDCGIYHFSNEGIISWFDFASEIKAQARLTCHIHPIPTSNYPTPAKRPHYSVLDKEKIQGLGIVLRDWRQSLAACLSEMGYEL